MIPESAIQNLNYLAKQVARHPVRKIINGKPKMVDIFALEFVINAFETELKSTTDAKKKIFYQLMLKFLRDEKPTKQDSEDLQSLKLPTQNVVYMSPWLPEIIQQSPFSMKVGQVALTLPEWVALNNPAQKNEEDAGYVFVELEQDNNSNSSSPPSKGLFPQSDSTHSMPSNNSQEDLTAAAQISSDRAKLINTFENKRRLNVINLFNRNSNYDNLILDAAYGDLINELKDPNLKISFIRRRERTFELNKTGYTIDHALKDESLQAALNKVQEKEEIKYTPAFRPLEEPERKNKIGFIIIRAQQIFDVHKFPKASSKDLKTLQFAIVQIKKIKNELAKHGQPLTEDDIKNYDKEDNVKIVLDNAAAYWKICKEIEQPKNANLIDACNRLEIFCEQKMLDIYQKDYPGAQVLPNNCASIEKLKNLNQLLEILKNDNIDPDEKLHQFANKIYGNEPFEIPKDERRAFYNIVETVLIEKPQAAVAILLMKFKHYKTYLFNNDGEGTYKWNATQNIISILESAKPAAEKIQEASDAITTHKNTLSNARNPFAGFINLWAWIQNQYKQLSSGAYKTQMFAVWEDVASSRSKGASVVSDAETFAKVSAPKKSS